MSNTLKVAAGIVLLIVAGGLALSPLGSSVADWVYGVVLLAMVVGLVLGVRRLNRQVDELGSDEHSRRSTSVWLAGALSVRHGSFGPGSASSGELLAGPKGGARVAGEPTGPPRASRRARTPRS